MTLEVHVLAREGLSPGVALTQRGVAGHRAMGVWPGGGAAQPQGPVDWVPAEKGTGEGPALLNCGVGVGWCHCPGGSRWDRKWAHAVDASAIPTQLSSFQSRKSDSYKADTADLKTAYTCQEGKAWAFLGPLCTCAGGAFHRGPLAFGTAAKRPRKKANGSLGLAAWRTTTRALPDPRGAGVTTV